mgnify:CR=1 FL=1
MDALDELIRDAREKVRELKLALTAAEAELAAFEKAAALRPATTEPRNAPAGRGGKPKGAISKAWKDTLAELYKYGRRYPYADIQSCYEHVNETQLALASIRDRVRALVETGYLEGDPADGFKVTETAAFKFKFPPQSQDDHG